ncbi:MAG: BACON domain-containing carbohydrate-binding protein [Bacteroidia bacterium]|nr:BACON domain-containing carbohydrate-binding protein [Bacteroidia bacterium]
MSSRTGTISIDGQNLSIIQPGLVCTYLLSQTSYTCPDNHANTYNAVVTMIAQTGCAWNSVVTSGGSWLTCTSSGSGNGNINITVSLNTSINPRTGTISVQGQTLTIIQPGANCTYSFSLSSYSCPNSNANTYSNIALVNTQAGCLWNASVSSGNSWLTTSSTGTGSGSLSIIVLENTGTSPRTGTISVETQILTIIQPAYGSGIEEVNSDFINIFPNPTYESININTNPLLLNHRFEIIDVNGKILYSGKIINPSMTVSLSVFPSGVYVLRIPDFNMMYKLIKL